MHLCIVAYHKQYCANFQCCIAHSNTWQYYCNYCFNIVQYPSSNAFEHYCSVMRKMLILLLLCTQQCTCNKSINIVQYPSHDKHICALLLIMSNVVQNVNLSVSLHSALCSRILALVALHSALCGSTLAIIAIKLCNTHQSEYELVHCLPTINNFMQILILLLHCTQQYTCRFSTLWQYTSSNRINIVQYRCHHSSS